MNYCNLFAWMLRLLKYLGQVTLLNLNLLSFGVPVAASVNLKNTSWFLLFINLVSDTSYSMLLVCSLSVHVKKGVASSCFGCCGTIP